MVEFKDIASIILIGILLYLGYFVFDIEGKNKGKKQQTNILKPITDKLRDFARWVNRQ